MPKIDDTREQYFHREVGSQEFYNEISRAEKALNIGHITTYDATRNVTKWYVSGYFGYTKGRIGESYAYFLSVPYAEFDRARRIEGGMGNE